MTDPLSDSQVAQAQQLADRLGQRVTVETGPLNVNVAAIQTVVLAVAAVLSLLIVAVGLALIAAETRRDDALLAQVGAAPNTRRSLAAARAGTLTLLGGILAVPAGLLPIWGLSATATTGIGAGVYGFPIATVVAVVVVVPALAAAGAWLATRPGATTLTARRAT